MWKADISVGSDFLVPFKNTLWLFGERFVVLASLLVVSVALARHLGPEAFGALSYILAIVALLVPLSTMGFNAIVTRELVSNPEKEFEIISTVLLLRTIGALLFFIACSVLIYFFVFAIDPSLKRGLIVLLLSNIFTSFSVLTFWFEAKVASRPIVTARMLVTVFFALLKLLYVYIGAELDAFIYLAAVETCFNALAVALVYNKSGGKVRFGWVNLSYGLALFKQSYWLILSGFAAAVYLKIDQVMLGTMLTQNDVGIYAVASRLSEVWYFIPAAMVASIFPGLLEARFVSQKSYKERLQTISNLLFLLALCMAILVSFIAEKLIPLLYGEDYLPSVAILEIHIWAGLFIFMRALLSKWFVAENLFQFSLITHVAGAVVNVGLNFLLIPKYHGVGAAVATVISYAFSSYIALFFHTSTREMGYIMTRSIFFPVVFIWTSIYKSSVRRV